MKGNGPIVSSWSSGKDSCLALYRAMQKGYQVKNLVNFISKEYKRCCFHGIPAELIRMQVDSIGIPLVQKEVTADMAEYEKEFKQTVSGIGGIEGMVFGDIYLDEHKEWVERVCNEIGIKAIEPLWGEDPKELVQEFLSAGFRALIVSCQESKMGSEFIGREVDEGLADELIARGVCPCGENGEFHTFVVDGPIFSSRIEITEKETLLKEGFWKHWFMDVKQYKCVAKKQAFRGSPGMIPGTVAQR